MNLEQIQHLADGLVENRKNIVDDRLDMYDSQAMDFFEQLERYDIHFPDLVLGEEPDQPPSEDAEALEHDFARVREKLRLMGAKFNMLISMMKNHPKMHSEKLKLCHAGLDDIEEAYYHIFGEEIPWKREQP